MREVKRSGSQSDAKLAGAMKSLAASAPASAPPEMLDRLSGQFQRHHRRRRVQRFALAGLAACVVLGASLLMKTPAVIPSQVTNHKPTSNIPTNSKTAFGETKPVAANPPSHASGPQRAGTGHLRSVGASARNASSPSREFVALPAYNRMVRLEDTNVVRVEMPSNTLRLVGAPVGAASNQSRVVADFVVGHDGTPYAVRLIAVRNMQ